MIDNFAWYGIIARSIAGLFLLGLFIVQVRIYSAESDYKRLKLLLLIALGLLFIGNLLSVGINLFRADDGNLIDIARKVATVINATSVLALSVVLYLIYKFDLTERNK